MLQQLRTNIRTIITTAILLCAGTMIAGTAYLAGWTMAEMELRFEDKTIAQSSERGSVLREVQDLAAQNTMALWTMVVAIAGVVSLGITTVGVVAVWRTLEETRKAVEATSAGTQAMREATLVSETIGKAQTQAYLTVTDVTYDGEHGIVRIHFNVRNTGQSTARRVHLRASGMWLFNEDRFLPVGASPRNYTWEDIGSGSPPVSIAAGIDEVITLDFWSEKVPDEYQLSINERLHAMSAQCICEWQDVFKDTHSVTFTIRSPTMNAGRMPEKGSLSIEWLNEKGT